MYVWYKTKEEWLADRVNHLGSTDNVSINGYNKWSSALDVYNERTGKKQGFAGNAASTLGSHIENGLLRLCAEEHDAEIEYINEDDKPILGVRNDKYPFIQVSPDGIFKVNGVRTLIECKTTNIYVTDPEVDMPSWIVQSNNNAVEIGVSDYIIVYFSFPTGTYNFFYGKVDLELYESCLKNTVNFWNNNLQKGIAPEPAIGRDVDRYYDSIADKCMNATAQIEELINQVKHYQGLEKNASELVDYYKDQIKLEMKDYEYIIGSDGVKLLSYKSGTRKSIDADLLKKNYPVIAKECTKESQVRVMRFNQKQF